MTHSEECADRLQERSDGRSTVRIVGNGIEREHHQVHEDDTKATVKQMLQEQEDEERMKQIMSEFETMTPEQQAAVRERLQELNLTIEEMAERFLILGKEVEKLVAQIIEGLKPCMDALKMAWANIVYIDEPWEIERLKMSNNERRRRGIPMIRRRQYIRIRQNRKKKKKG